MSRRMLTIAILSTCIASSSRASVTDQVEHRVEISAAVAAATAKELVIEYSVANRSTAPIYVFDIVARFEKGQVVVDDHAAYVVLDKDGAVRIIVALLKLTKRINATPPVLVSVVEAGQVRRNTLKLALPLRERHPYFAIVEGDQGAAAQASSVRLQVGWVEQRGQANLGERKIGTATYHQLTGNWGQPLQRIKTIELPAANLGVVRHPEPIAQHTIFTQ
jgi:hypothetical protein